MKTSEWFSLIALSLISQLILFIVLDNNTSRLVEMCKAEQRGAEIKLLNIY